MLKKIFKLVSLSILALIVVVMVQTYRFSKPIPFTKALNIPALNDSSVQHLSKAIQIKTISYSEASSTDSMAFTQFKKFLENAYPLIHQQLQRTIINQFSYIYEWSGKNSSLPPFILMAHSDVVPVEKASEKFWRIPPFSGTITDTAIFGRGAIDDKGSLIAILEATEQLLSQHFQPERTIYLCFGHTEEIGGKKGAQDIADYLFKKNIKAGLVLDEGGIVTKENFKELGRPIALIGVTEKGYATFELTVEKEGGHSSMPAKETAIDILSNALVNLRKKQMPVYITAPTNSMLEKIGPGLGFTTRMALANRWLFEPILIAQFEKANATNASIHTTIVPTIISGGIKDNVIPTEAKAIVNSRIIPGESTANVEAFMQNQIKDERVKIKLIFASQTNHISSQDSNAYKIIESATYKVFDNVIPTPFLMIGATDSRYFEKVSENIIKFNPCIDPKGFHGIDERMMLDDFKRMIFFYQLVIQQ